MARNLVNGDYLLTDANGAPLMPWNYDINLTILTKNIKPEGINNLLNAFIWKNNGNLNWPLKNLLKRKRMLKTNQKE